MKVIACILFVFLLLFKGALAQEEYVRGVCGTSMQDQLVMEPRLLANLERIGRIAQERGNIRYVPVHFHLVGDSQGKGKILESRVLEQLCALNRAFEPMNIRFYLRPHPTNGTLFNYNINDNNVYNNQTAWSIMQAQRHPGAINIYIVNQAATNNNQPGVTLAYYSPQRDWIVCRKDQISGSKSNSTLPHEIGHFFSLQHTFFGWESQPFNNTFPTWPRAPITSPGGVPTERMNGTNCTTAADKICDTPPDYNFGFNATICSYNGGAQDPLGVPVSPMANNMMGYFNFCSEYVFTPQQQSAILADLASSARKYLINNFLPVATEINTPPDLLISPVGGVNVPFYDEVVVEWKAVPGATYYLVEFDIVNSFSSSFAQSFITKNTSLTVNSLQPNRIYQWRVRPFNEYVTCAAARQSSFRTSNVSSLGEITQVRRQYLAPNPVKLGGGPRLIVESISSFMADVYVFDAAGRQLFERSKFFFTAGENSIELPVEIFGAAGIYFITLQGHNGRSVLRLVVTP
ncbi:MAG: T9SS type A sorting domain-containing protein [Saprospiraceae bacterium]|nr:T9SS type A sorting domain-containing protein [Saprospiraceae bacterium]MDW8482883.1 T9SS type A sorting domain-containing protein [Saprospiraceae bacterium]